MFNRRISLLTGALIATVAAAAPRVFGAENIERHISRYGGTSGYRQRSRGPQAKRRKRPNMLTVSKRVRRKHRRAA